MGKGRGEKWGGRQRGGEEGRERKGRDGGGRGKVTEGMGGTADRTWDGTGREGKEEGDRKRGEGYNPPNFNSRRRHWLQFGE